MEKLLNSFDQIIKDARITAGMTQDSLAEQAGVTPRYIMAIENDKLRNTRVLLYQKL